jgi:hypothetical protein
MSRQEGGKGIKDQGGRRPLFVRKERTTVNGIRRRNSGELSRLGSGETLKKTLYEISESKIAKQILESSIRMRKMIGWTLWRGRLLPKRKKRLHTE